MAGITPPLPHPHSLRTRWWGVALMFYPYVVSATWLLYAVGVALCLGMWWDGQRG